MNIGLKRSKKPVRGRCDYPASEGRDMEREITQLCSLEGEVLGALEWLEGIDDAYARQKNLVAD